MGAGQEVFRSRGVEVVGEAYLHNVSVDLGHFCMSLQMGSGVRKSGPRWGKSRVGLAFLFYFILIDVLGMTFSISYSNAKGLKSVNLW